MKAIEVIIDSKEKTCLQVFSCSVPKIKDNEVLIKIHAAGVNHADLFQAAGKYPPPDGASSILGLEAAGEIVEIGKAVKGWSKGQRVCALLEGGGYAQYVAVAAGQILEIPDNMSFIEAASLPEVVFTVWYNLFDIAKIKEGQSLLVHGGASGIGTMAIQMAKAFNIDCYVTAGSKEKCEILENLGAKKAICYKDEDFVDIVKDQTNGRGVDVVLDMVGADYFQENLKILSYGGTFISIAFLSGSRADINLAPLVFKNINWVGTTIRNKSEALKADIAKNIRKFIFPQIENGNIKPIVDSVFDLSDAQMAHEYMQSRKHIGKIILNCTV
ncbi:NAD(P)H-quinone oxidoreductase [Rickettsiales bacterium]|nr:NAD(P)H-quinone oxidoreductase [Rickettsiales bacterium]